MDHVSLFLASALETSLVSIKEGLFVAVRSLFGLHVGLVATCLQAGA